MKTIILSTVIFFFASCSMFQRNDSTVQLTNNLPAQKYSNIYFSGQPEVEDFKVLKDQGFMTVINLRNKKEHSENEEKAVVKSNGMNYYNFGIRKSPITDKWLDQITEKVKKHRDEGKILIHCSSGNRAGMWAGAHFFKDHNYSKEDSIKMGKKLGITKEKIEKKLQNYLSSR